MKPSENIFKNKPVLIVIGINVLLFVISLSQPIFWSNQERLWQAFFWSMNDLHNFEMHMGLWPQDFLKPFFDFFVDGTFRTRQVSYLTEMISFKFWQHFEAVLIRDYTLIALHLFNTALIFTIVVQKTKNKFAGLCAALLVLNAGCGLATLLYPFRNAKILSVTFFLLSWVLVNQQDHQPPSQKRWTWPFLLIVLSCLTDEVAYFLFPIIFIDLIRQYGFGALKDKRLLVGAIGSVCVFAIIVLLSYSISKHVSTAGLNSGSQIQFIKGLTHYYTVPLKVLQDVNTGFFCYFLPRNFGNWGFSLWGIIGFLCFIQIFLLAWLPQTRINARGIAMIVFVVLILKNFLLPHNAGYHYVFMPEGTYFPSLLFFSYYYTYPEAILLCLVLGLSLNVKHYDHRLNLYVLGLISLLNFSNIVQLYGGPQDVLKFTNASKPSRARIEEVVAVSQVLKKKAHLPVYLSFPAGEQRVLKGRREDNMLITFHQHMIPIRYLKSIKEGQAIVSYDNLKPQKPFPFSDELSNAHTFYDVLEKKEFNIAQLKKMLGMEALKPKLIEANSSKLQRISLEGKASQVVFFIKGKAEFIGKYSEKKIFGKQSYGHSYQKFEIDLNALHWPRPKTLDMVITAGAVDISLVGPFLIQGQPLKDEEERTRQAQGDQFILQGSLKFKSATNLANLASAIDDYHKAINVYPKQLEYYLLLAQTYLELNSFDDATLVLRGALITFPYEPRIHFLLAKVLAQKKDYTLAMYEAKRSADLFYDRFDLDNTNEVIRFITQK